MRIAVIDIGSNAIRAAIYENNKLGSPEIFNEKFRSDLHALLERDSIYIKHSTYSIFQYFISIFRRLNVTNITCVATEVLRNHEKAQEFIDEIQKKFGLTIKVLTGDEEARITAEGLISSIPDANGIAADLGGGSLELAEIHDKSVHQVKSLPLGTKALTKIHPTDPAYIEEKLAKYFEKKKHENLYLIGGALRLLGRCYMDINGSSIKNLHNLVIERSEFESFLEQLSGLQKFDRFLKQFKVNKYAVVVMQALVNYFDPNRMIVSTYGLKEGVRFGLLSKEEQKRDIVFDRCNEYFLPYIQNLEIEEYIKIFVSLGFNCNKEELNLLKIALVLSQYTRNIDKNYKAEWVINFILTTDIPFNQYQRVSLIVSVAAALSSKTNIIPRGLKKVLSKKEFAFAQGLGAFVKIALILDGPVLTKPSFDIVCNNRFLDIKIDIILPKNVFEKVCEELKTIGFAKKTYHE